MDVMFVLIIFGAFVLGCWQSLTPTNEWQMLAEKYGADYERGPSVKCWISLRYPPFSQSLLVNRSGEFFDGLLTVTPRGLFINLWFFRSFWRSALLVPWSDISVIGHRGRYEFDGDRVFVTFAQVPNIRMRISGDALDALLKAGAPWQITNEGTVESLANAVVTVE